MSIKNEVSQLKKVLIHQPDQGIKEVTPGNALELLYEDIVFLKKMQEEHQTFTQVIDMFCGTSTTVEIEVLLEQVLENPRVKNALIEEVASFENLTLSQVDSCKTEDAKSLAHLLITGLDKNNMTIIPPLPNLIFTRDLGTVVKEYIIIGRHSRKARQRETLLSKYIFSHHPMFDHFTPIILPEDPYMTIEGGDICVVNDSTIMVGCSERTSPEAIDWLKNEMFNKSIIEHFIKVDIPKFRYCMHLDTIFTLIDNHDCVLFESILLKKGGSHIEWFQKNKLKDTYTEMKSLFKALEIPMNFILCGQGNYPYDEREQWTDGCNFVSLKPGVAIGYERNVETGKALIDQGYKVISASTFLESASQKLINPKSISKTIITISASELSRARGGPHCMTMPILRE